MQNAGYRLAVVCSKTVEAAPLVTGDRQQCLASLEPATCTLQHFPDKPDNTCKEI